MLSVLTRVGVVCVLLATGATAVAQPYNSDLISVDKGGRIWRTTLNGTAKSLYQFPGIANSVRMYVGNDELIVTCSGGSATVPAGIYRFDPRSSLLQTVMALPGVIPFEAMQDQDGNYVFTGNSQGTFGLWRYRVATNQFQKIIDLRRLGIVTAPLDGGLIKNIFTGNFLFGGGAFAPQASEFFWDVSAGGVANTLMRSGPGRYSIAQDRRNGNIYVSGWQEVFKIDYGTSQRTTLIRGPGDFYAITLDRASPQTQMMYIRSISDIFAVDVDTGAYTTMRTSLSGSPVYEVIPYQNRTISTELVLPETWRITLSFPGEGGTPYAIGLSASGFRPGILIPGRRRIHLVPDTLTVLSLGNLIPTVFRPGTGRLDGQGVATAFIDTSNIGKLDVPIWLVAVTIANGRIQTVSDPYVIRLP